MGLGSGVGLGVGSEEGCVGFGVGFGVGSAVGVVGCAVGVLVGLIVGFEFDVTPLCTVLVDEPVAFNFLDDCLNFLEILTEILSSLE